MVDHTRDEPTEPKDEGPPPYEPDPELFGHAENSARWLRYYRKGLETPPRPPRGER